MSDEKYVKIVFVGSLVLATAWVAHTCGRDKGKNEQSLHTKATACESAGGVLIRDSLDEPACIPGLK